MAQPRAKPKAKPEEKPAKPEGVVDTLTSKAKQFVADFKGIWHTTSPPTGAPKPATEDAHVGQGGLRGITRRHATDMYLEEATGVPTPKSKRKKE